MREFKIIIPVVNTRFKFVRQFEDCLLLQFGGFTRTDGFGAWRNHKIVDRERVWIYTVATDLEHTSSVRKLAADICAKLDETCIYVRHTDGEVEFVSP